LKKQSEIPNAMLCVNCASRASGVCEALFGSNSENLQGDRQLGWQHFITARADEQIASRNQISDDVFVLCAGWAFRYVQLSDGRRQILKFLLPGDMLSSTAFFERAFDFSVKALTKVQVSRFARSEISARYAAGPDVQVAVANSVIADAHDATELLTTLGQCSAEERIVHLLLHLTRRIAERNVIHEQRYPFPLRQQHIADAVGLTPVHVSRVIGLLRDRHLLDLSEGVLTVTNLPELERIGSLK
jgi:CRP/FNR family transcriptional regulator